MNNNGMNSGPNITGWLAGLGVAVALIVAGVMIDRYVGDAWNSKVGQLALVGFFIWCLTISVTLFLYSELKMLFERSFKELKEEINGDIAKLGKKVGALEVDFARFDERVKGLRRDFNGLKGRANRLENEVDELTHKTDRLLNSAEDLKAKARSLREEVERLIEESFSKEGSSKAALAKAQLLQAKAGELEGQADFLRDTLLKLQAKHKAPQKD